MSDPKDYAHVHDAQSQRTRWEMWAILAIVVVVIGGALVWRSLAHVPAKPQKGWEMQNAATSPTEVTPAAATGVHPTSTVRPSAP